MRKLFRYISISVNTYHSHNPLNRTNSCRTAGGLNSQSEKFSGQLCGNVGYKFAFKKDVSGKGFAKKRSFERPIRNEINSLADCMFEAELDWSLPAPTAMTEFIESSDKPIAAPTNFGNAPMFVALNPMAL